jgi:hypothetical protein
MVLTEESVKKKLDEIMARQKKDQIAQHEHLSTATIAGSAGGNTAAGSIGMQHLPASALQKEDLERTNRFVRYRGEDLHNTWTEGNERAQVRVCERCPVPARDGAVRSGADVCSALTVSAAACAAAALRRGRQPTWPCPPPNRCSAGGLRLRRTGSRRGSRHAATTTRRRTARPRLSRLRLAFARMFAHGA